MLSRHKLQADADFKPALLGAIRVLNSDWLNDSIMNGDWLYFSHVKNAIRKPDWTYRIDVLLYIQ